MTGLDERMGTTGLRALVAVATMTMATWAGAAHAPELAALQRLRTGAWDLRQRDDPAAPPRRLCVQDQAQLLEIPHGGAACKRFVVKDAPMMTTVTFDCGAAGSARTDLRVETTGLVQIHSQGIADGAPFSLALEGRYVGACH